GHEHGQYLRFRISYEQLEHLLGPGTVPISVRRLWGWAGRIPEPDYRRALRRVDLPRGIAGRRARVEAHQIPNVEHLGLQWLRLHAHAANQPGQRRNQLAYPQARFYEQSNHSLL